MAVLEVPRSVLRGVTAQPEAQQAVRPAVELHWEGRQREAERTGVQLVQLVPSPAPPWMMVGLQVGLRPPKKDSRQRRRSHDSLC